MKPLRSRLTYANVLSTLCLFLLVGGGAAYAATQLLPKNSVGSKQLKKGAVTPAKLSSAAKRGLTGPQGPQGVPGKEGPAGRNLTATTPLASGVTETGVFAAAGGGPGAAAGAMMTATASFVQPLPAPLDLKHVIYLAEGETSAPHCPGEGHADPGYFCAYTGYAQNAEIFTTFEDPRTGNAGAGRNGTNAYGRTLVAERGNIAGTWAVTAP
jgi:hypothetical protein